MHELQSLNQLAMLLKEQENLDHSTGSEIGVLPDQLGAGAVEMSINEAHSGQLRGRNWVQDASSNSAI
ncbi:hypothetical protein BG011_006106 [Mortierella polycephala]|uniref:Uncharacterized protein n=1 Tax=Mortierella polycephala TaxID=41804 RepID=A0A9P6PWA8_9FUNG|nr:hypothetical protein BG011_006106 [Mortierella polycephala]